MNNPSLYATLLDSIRSGGDVVPAPLVRSILATAGVTEDEFRHDLLTAGAFVQDELARHDATVAELVRRLQVVRAGISDQLMGHLEDYDALSRSRQAIVTTLQALDPESAASSNYPGSIEGQE